MDPKELEALLAHTLGEEKSRTVVEAAMAKLGMRPGPLQRSQVLAILALTAKGHGIVSVASRFAKARLILGKDGKRS